MFFLHGTDQETAAIYHGMWDTQSNQRLPYFFDYKTEFFSFQNHSKDLDPSCKMDLDLWDCLGRVKNWYYSKIS